MKPRHLALGAALLLAAALVLFGDRTPGGDVAEAVVRPAGGAGGGTGKAAPRAAAALVPNAALAGNAGASAVPVPVPVVAPSIANANAGTSASGANARAPAILALVPRDQLIGDSDRFGQDGAATAGVFGHQDWTPPPPPPQPAPPAPPPTAPPLPFTFIGKSVGEGNWEVYLARGERTYVVRANEVIDGMYRVDAIAPPILTLTYLPLNQVQQLNIGVFE